jgi:hypothetical protein
MEEKLARRLVQVGIRTMSGHQMEQAKRFGVEVISMRNLARFAQVKFEGPCTSPLISTFSIPPSRPVSHITSPVACRFAKR